MAVAPVLFTQGEKDRIRTLFPSPAKVLTAARIRVYMRPPTRGWEYSGLEGALVLLREAEGGSLWFKLVDLANRDQVIWELRLPDSFDYKWEGPFFHSFPGQNCAMGFIFSDESKANAFFHKVKPRSLYSQASRGSSPVVASSPSFLSSFTVSNINLSHSSSVSGKLGSNEKRSRKIDKASISKPSSFRHVGHIGFDSSEKGLSASGVDLSWHSLLHKFRAEIAGQ